MDGWVEVLQKMLNVSLDPSPNLRVDGNFENETLKAVRRYQKDQGIQVDGVVGNQTWAQLRGGTATKPSTDGRPPHTFVDKGVTARWFREDELATYLKDSDEMSLMLFSVGDAKLEGGKVTVRVTAPGSKGKVVTAKIGAPIGRTPDDQGDLHEVTLANFKTTFPSNPSGAKSTEYFVEAYFDKSEGGDFWQGKIVGDDS